MKRREWLLAAIFIAMGLLCLSMSATPFSGNPLRAFGRTLGQLCLWLGLPVLILWVFVWNRRRGRRNR